METYPSARAQSRSLSSLRSASRLFPPSSFVPRRTLIQRMRKKEIPARRVYKRESGLFLAVPPGIAGRRGCAAATVLLAL